MLTQDTAKGIQQKPVLCGSCLGSIDSPPVHLCDQGRAGHRPQGHLLQDSLCADANAIAGLQPAGGPRQPGLLGPPSCGAVLFHDLHLRTV